MRLLGIQTKKSFFINIDNTLSYKSMVENYTFPIKKRVKNYTFPMKIGVGNHTFLKKAVF